jgi:hypothetical protein
VIGGASRKIRGRISIIVDVFIITIVVIVMGIIVIS